MDFIIETDRLYLREIIEEDAQDLFELDSDVEVHKYLGNNPVKNIEESKAIIKNIRQQYLDNGLGRLAVIEKGTNNFLGWSALKFETGLIDDLEYYDLGYRLKKKYWGKGFASESAIASVEYGFNKLNLDEIFAAAHVDNIGSNKVILNSGLKLVDTIVIDGEIHNWYRIRKSDWLKNN